MKVDRMLALVCLLLSWILLSCQPTSLSPDGLAAFIDDEGNGLKKTVTVGGTTIELLYRPTDVLVSQEIGSNVLSQASLDSLRDKYDDYFYFIVNLSKDNKEALQIQENGFGQYSELVQTLAFNMSDYTTMTTASRDTIPVADYVLNRTYGLSSATEMLFVFNRENAITNEWVQINLNEFGLQTGNQRFRFETLDLLNGPTIDFRTQ